MNSPRPKPYVWVTWITALLAGTDKCEWKSWTKAHFRYAKVPSDGGFDLEAWTRQHDAMTTTRVKQLKELGLTVEVEEQNAFKLDGRNAVLAGKPDIVAKQPKERIALIIDEKSGKPKDSDRWQVLVYMWAMALTKLQTWLTSGEVEYRGSSLTIKPDELDLSTKNHIIRVMNIVGGPVEPPRTPSLAECKYCDILGCVDRMASTTATATVSEF
jgi:hypothetical protein